MARFAALLDAALDRLERDELFDELACIGEIAVAAFLTYLDLRWPERDWRGARPALARQGRPAGRGRPFRRLAGAAWRPGRGAGGGSAGARVRMCRFRPARGPARVRA